jgi:hypothetical protein
MMHSTLVAGNVLQKTTNMLHPNEADPCMPIPPADAGLLNRTDEYSIRRTCEYASPQIPLPLAHN